MLARDVFSLAHFPMLCGIVGIAATIEEAIAHPDGPLAFEWRLALGFGLLLFVGGSSLAKWRALGILPVLRVGIGVSTTAAILLLAEVPPAVSLAVAIAGTAAVALSERPPR
jgi:low temperature requirement protein LtrA